MILVFALAVAVLFGAGCYLLLKDDLIRLVVGMVLIGNAANLFIMTAGLQRGAAPILPIQDEPSDPLVQAMTLTAIVISFGVTVLVLSLAYRVYTSHSSVDVRELSQAEEEQADLDDAVGALDLHDFDAVTDERDDVHVHGRRRVTQVRER